MPAKKPNDPKQSNDPKPPAPTADLKPNPVNPARPQDPDPDDMQTPKNYTVTGDAEPLGAHDPLLSPDAQQPFESAEDYERRRPKTPEPS